MFQRHLRHWLVGHHQVDTAYELGWAEVTNGSLLRLAEDAGFDVLVTSDKGIRYQQNLTGRTLALVLMSTNDWTQIRNFKSIVIAGISNAVLGTFVEIDIPMRRASP
jgi:hypothetical protein